MGKLVDAVIRNIPPHLHVKIDRYVIMPNHIHMILMITGADVVRESWESPKHGRSIISKTVGYIKMNASKAIRQRFGDVTIWQRGYHDHVIRNQEDYEMVAKYVYENPIRWEVDKLYSAE